MIRARGAAIAALTIASLLFLAGPAAAHFGMVIPDRNIVSADDPKVIGLSFLFWHPMENQGMDLAKPQVGVLFDGRKSPLQVSEKKVKDRATWTASYRIKRPGDYVFYMEPQPYWEPAEDCFIIHYTKTVVSALAAEEGWDALVGTKMEIQPLTKPYGLYAGNSFTGRVLYKGKPLADCEVEAEFYNADEKRKAPSDSHVTQLVKADANGVFTFALPWAGWWGFSALHTDEAKMKHQGSDKDVELGGVIWVYAHPAP